MREILVWALRKLGVSTILSWWLLLTALISIALGLNSVIRGLDVDLVMTITILGVFTGWLIGKLRLSNRLAFLLALVLGIGIVFLRVGKIGSKIVALIQAIIMLAQQILEWRIWRPFPDARAVVEIFGQLMAQVNVLAIRLRDWIAAMAGGVPVFDPVAAALMWSFLVWAISLWAGWQVRRHARPLEALIPGMVFLAGILVYVGGNAVYFIPIAGALLLLMLLQSATAREHRWQSSGIDYAEDIRFDLVVYGGLISFLLTVMASISPSISINQIAHSVERMLTHPTGETNRFADSIGLIPQPKPTTLFDALRMPGLPRRHLIGAGPELSQQTALIVQIDPNSAPPPHYYWRSNTYEKYTGSGWTTDADVLIDYQAGERTMSDSPSKQRLVRQEIQTVGNSTGIVYAAGTLVSTDHDFQVEWRSQADKDFFGAMIQGNPYRVESLVPIVGEAALRTSENNYPDWIRARYLTLPADVPERVLSLARDLTATAPTPYDRARAIESYLRQFPYTTNLPAPPPNRDVVDYFLFDLKRGYCDYYASAMVVLARAAGLPARLVVGYGTGTYDASTARFRVTEADAHSWVELYFPNDGWIEFEPTGGREPIEHSETILPELHDSGEKIGEPFTTRWMPNASLWLLLPGCIAFAMLMILFWSMVELTRLRWSEPQAAIDRIYRQFYDHAHRLGLAAHSADTPHEIERQLIERIEFSDAEKSREEIRLLIALYVRRRYSAHPINGEVKRRAIKAWTHLNVQFWRIWIKQVGYLKIKNKLETRSRPLRESGRVV